MKRKYRKPYLAVESFQLDAAIAGACKDSGLQTLSHGMNTCDLLEESGQAVPYFGNACNLDIFSSNPDGLCYQAGFADLVAVYLES